MAATLLLMCSIASFPVMTICGYASWSSGQSLERFLIDDDNSVLYVTAINMIYALPIPTLSSNVSYIDETPSTATVTQCMNQHFVPADSCQNNHYVINFPNINVSLSRTVNPGLGPFYTADTFITCSTNSSRPSCQYRKRKTMEVLQVVSGAGFIPYSLYNGTKSLILSTGQMIAGTARDELNIGFVISLSDLPFSGNVAVTTDYTNDRVINRVPNPRFLSVHEIGSYVYLFFTEKGVESSSSNPAIYSRVARVCMTDSGTITQSLVGIGTFNEFKSLTKARITCSANNGDQSDLTYFYDQIQSTFLLSNGSFDGSGTSQMHMYGVFTSASYGPLGSAVCAYSYNVSTSDLGGAFQTNDFLAYDAVNHHTGPYVDCNTRNDATTMLSPLLSATITQAQGPSPIFSALGYAFRRIVVAQVTALNGIMYDVLFIAASSGNQLLMLKMTYVASRAGSPQYTSRSIPVGTSAEWVVQMSLSTSSSRPKAVYLATNARLTVIPVDDCNAYTSCSACVGARDPYCAYNTLTRTCVNASSAPRQNLLQDVIMGSAASLCPAKVSISESVLLSATGIPFLKDSIGHKTSRNVQYTKGHITNIAHASHHTNHLNKAIEKSAAHPSGHKLHFMEAGKEAGSEWKEESNKNAERGYSKVALRQHQRAINGKRNLITSTQNNILQSITDAALADEHQKPLKLQYSEHINKGHTAFGIAKHVKWDIDEKPEKRLSGTPAKNINPESEARKPITGHRGLYTLRGPTVPEGTGSKR